MLSMLVPVWQPHLSGAMHLTNWSNQESCRATAAAAAARATLAAATARQVDTAKDMVDNCAGMMLALIALATCGSSHPHASNSNNQAGLDT